jgi:hypothetical protein
LYDGLLDVFMLGSSEKEEIVESHAWVPQISVTRDKEAGKS